MKRTIFGAFALIALALSISVTASNAGSDETHQFLVDWSNTPEEHADMARFYTGKAQEARQEAARHREMGERYGETKMKDRRMQKEHCDRIVSLHLQMADEYEALGRNHRNEATDHSTDPDAASR